MTDSFPRQQARTQNFTLGAPRSFKVSPDGSRIAFLRSQSGTDPVTCLWLHNVTSGAERLIADPAQIGVPADEPAEERARRERSREQAGGIVAFSTDKEFTRAAFAVAGQVYMTSLEPDGAPAVLAGARSPAIDPRLDPTGQLLSYVNAGVVRITDLRSGADTELIGPSRDAHAEPGTVSYGLAEFIAAEEMHRLRGYWWAPDGSALLVARVDDSAVQRWQIADPAHPEQPPAVVGYPAAGTANATVTLLLVRLDGSVTDVQLPDGFPYLVTADWSDHGLLLVVQSRDQRRMRLLAADPATGATSQLREDDDAHWVDVVSGVPATTTDGRVAWTADQDGAKRLFLAAPGNLAGAQPATEKDLQIRAVLSVDGDTVLFAASGREPTELDVWSLGPDGLIKLAGADGDGPGLGQPGVYSAVRDGGTTVVAGRTLTSRSPSVTVVRQGAIVGTVASVAQAPSLPQSEITVISAGDRAIRTALILPSWHQPGSVKLPVLMDPYGGPHAQRVVAAGAAYLTSQWFAEQGFAVIVADGRGTPGRGPDWDRSVSGDLATPALEDQVVALAAAAEQCADLDLSKVAIRGWSFGGYLAALAVLRRPDVFHAAVAGAPVTDWRLYDTHYTERYLGDPATAQAVYDGSSLLADAPALARPLLFIHGLADDNVVVAHTLRMSSALLAAGRPHYVLPLTGVTHMASQEEVAENLLLLQVDFIRNALGIVSGAGSAVPTAPGQASAV